MKRIILILVLSAMLTVFPFWASGFIRTAQSELTITLTMGSQYYRPAELVNVSGTVNTTEGSPVENVAVGIQVLDPKNDTIFLDIAYSLSGGIYDDSFRLDLHSSSGQYEVYVSASAIGFDTARNQTTFRTHAIFADLTGGTRNPWDFIPDGKVDGKDIAIVALCFGSAPGSPPPYIWNPNSDVNNDAKVDGKDIALVALHFGQADP